MTLNDGWAKAAIRVVFSGLPPEPLSGDLSRHAAASRHPEVLTFPIADESELDLQSLLESVLQFASEHTEALVDLCRQPGAQLQVFLGWSPNAPQESVVLTPALVGLLASLGAEIVIDAYAE